MSSKHDIDQDLRALSLACVSSPGRPSSDDPTTDAPRTERGSDVPDDMDDDPRSTSHAQRQTTDAHAHASRRTTDAHAHAHAHVDTRSGRFPHEKLDAYRVALEQAALAQKLAEQIPRGHRSIADHLLRAASNTVLLFAEGANRRGSALKRQRFVESRGECAEVAAAADLVLVLKIGSPAEAERLKHLAGRVSAMLTRLIARLA
jgi:four helix bundle protein